MSAAVAGLAELGEKPESIAEQTELPLTEVRRLLKLAEESPSSGGAWRSPAAARSDSAGAEPVELAG